MFIFRYDKTFEGLLTAVFDAYSMKKFPDMLVIRTSGDRHVLVPLHAKSRERPSLHRT